ncbi:MAG: hypothetical protein ACJ8DI_16675 [Ktedonobacteraceae bacterium]
MDLRDVLAVILSAAAVILSAAAVILSAAAVILSAAKDLSVRGARPFAALSGKDDSGASLEASTRAFLDEPLAGRFRGELVGEGRGEIDLLALGHQIALILRAQHRLRRPRRHEPVGTEDGHLVLQGRHIERFIAGVVVGRHLLGDRSAVCVCIHLSVLT